MRMLVMIVLAGFITASHTDYPPVTDNADWIPVIQEFDGVPMVLVPAGCFLMGSTEAEVEAAYASFVEQFGEDANVLRALEAEMPQHEQCFDEPFWLDQYPVSQGDMKRIVGNRSLRSTADRFLGDDRPVETINWYEARDFCALRGGRLPTEVEWEYAARGPDNLIYPWGDAWNAEQAIWNREETLGTAAVGSITSGASWVGAYDMIGNVWEWTSTIYDIDRYPYPYTTTDDRDTAANTEDLRVLRGAAWSSVTLTGFRSAYRVGSRPQSRYYSLGFRCMTEVG